MKKYLIVGASSGIGMRIGEDLLAEGHFVIAIHNKNPVTEQPGMKAIQLDVTTSQLDIPYCRILWMV